MNQHRNNPRFPRLFALVGGDVKKKKGISRHEASVGSQIIITAYSDRITRENTCFNINFRRKKEKCKLKIFRY